MVKELDFGLGSQSYRLQTNCPGERTVWDVPRCTWKPFYLDANSVRVTASRPKTFPKMKEVDWGQKACRRQGISFLAGSEDVK